MRSETHKLTTKTEKNSNNLKQENRMSTKNILYVNTVS